MWTALGKLDLGVELDNRLAGYSFYFFLCAVQGLIVSVAKSLGVANLQSIL